ncbi:TolC family protein [Novosphingobium sp. EMRT-2]|uniref:TolC family protein n=1 Tax=Novosphingobium sp. EMRT-2 TaxID=2571749 RepID=UPI0010BD2BF4|nr:TolC family protein [Novosphingobium sp. EMRT-2]QCI95789.1 TolC family protein [Novosphingobium sp. EMRT-2]
MRRLLAINALLLAVTTGVTASAADGGAVRPAPMATAMPAREDGQPSTPLTLDEVLRSSARAAPDIIAALARVRQAEGRALSAEGAFDTVFSVDARSRVAGYYDGSEITGKAERPLTGNGGYLYGQYRNSRGDFPIYEDKAYTNRLGEVKIGALYALLRDRMIDARRSATQLAGNDIDIARFETRATAIGVQARAIEAYQKWVESGLKLQAYQALYDIAAERGKGIRRQVQLGAKPEILLTENEANMVKREALVVQAQQEFRAAANKLSLYYRDAAGLPVLVDANRLPPSAAAFDGMNIDPFFEIEERPDFGILLEEIEQASVKLALAENDLRPRLDLKGEIAKDIGPVGAGGYSRSPLEVIFGVSLTVPLQNRKARGKLSESRAKLEELSVKQRYLAEKIRAEVAGIGIEVDTARELADATRRQVALADRLAEAERRRFALGSSDFFLVNSREEAATDAAVKLIEARARIAAARAQLAAATADESALKLDAREAGGSDAGERPF